MHSTSDFISFSNVSRGLHTWAALMRGDSKCFRHLISYISFFFNLICFLLPLLLPFKYSFCRDAAACSSLHVHHGSGAGTCCFLTGCWNLRATQSRDGKKYRTKYSQSEDNNCSVPGLSTTYFLSQQNYVLCYIISRKTAPAKSSWSSPALATASREEINDIGRNGLQKATRSTHTG